MPIKYHVTAKAKKHSSGSGMYLSGTVVATNSVSTISVYSAPPAAPTGIFFDNAAFTATATAQNSIGMVLTATSSAVLMVMVNLGGGAQTVSMVYAGAQSMTLLGGVNYRTAAGMRAELWGLTAAGTGALTISAVLVGAQTTSIGLGAATYTGHRTTNPFGGIFTASASAASAVAVAVSSTVDNKAVIFAGLPGGDVTVGSGITNRGYIADFPSILIADLAGANSATGTLATVTSTSYWGILGVNLIEAHVAESGSSSGLLSPLNAGHYTTAVDAPSSYVSIVTHGAVNDGTTDNLTAIKNALSAAKAASLPCFVPAGDYAYSGVITISAVAITGLGPTSILRGLTKSARALWLKGSGSSVKNLKLVTNNVTTRTAPWEHCGIIFDGCSDFAVDNIYIKPTEAAGMQFKANAGVGTITHCTVSGTRADSIHMTDRTHNVTLYLNRIQNSGDDGIACVSYSYDGGANSSIEAYANWIIDNSSGRNMSVVGGTNINYHNNLCQGNTQWAGIYLAQENSYQSLRCQSISCTYNTVINCGSTVTGHSGIMVFSDGTYTNSSISIVRCHIVQSAGAENGIRTFGPQNNLAYDSNRFSLSSTATNYVGTASAGCSITLYTSGNFGYEFDTP